MKPVNNEFTREDHGLRVFDPAFGNFLVINEDRSLPPLAEAAAVIGALPNGWSIGYSGNILANWKADKEGDTWTVPLGLQVAKVVKFGSPPVRLQLGGQYMVHHPDAGGQKWNIQVMVVPVIPKLIKGNLIE
jgi:hypothetical protein